MRCSGVVVKAFDGPRKTIIGEVDIPMKALYVDDNFIKKKWESMTSLKDTQQSTTTILEDNEEQEAQNFMTHGLICQNWTVVDVTFVTHLSKQQDETGSKENDIYYLSKKFTVYESRYSILEKTYCALAWAAKCLWQYMINHTTWLISKMDPIKYDFEKPALTGRISRWQMLLSEYDIEYRTQKVIKGIILVDHLAYQPIDDYQSIKFDFPDENVMYLKAKDCDESLPEEGPEPRSRWGLVFDGDVNAYYNRIEEIIITPQGSHIPFTTRLILVVNHIKRERETRHPSLIPYKDYARRLLTFFNKVEFHHTPREENQMVDALTTLSSMCKVNHWNDAPNIRIMRLDRPAHVFIEEEVTNDKP
ncbi:uncharacterized protein LOC127122968 [Lathyrus oleraceus]|uniref:uncharacterized protein LOC127122968 n=1 Tax=Pisum sativum TaxID=3888 RepID=UPI0021D2F741|nr:uncharacterized protein LOC127122968 [Pisum sativum]